MNTYKKISIIAAVVIFGFAYHHADARSFFGLRDSATTSVNTNTGTSIGVNSDTDVHANASGTIRERFLERTGLRASSSASSSIGIDRGDGIKAKQKSDEAITARIDALNKVSTRIDSMKKVLDSVKASVKASAQTEITNLSNLKIKIDADTDTSVLKTDVESITGSYRIYALVIPQEAILAAGDRALTIVDSMNALGAKIQTRISAAQAAGKDVSSYQSTYADFTAKVSAAGSEASAAINATASLTPDNHDQATFNANKAALETAKGSIKTSEEDLQAARKDIAALIKDAESVHVSASSSASASITK